MSYFDIGRGVEALYRFMLGALFISVPLGLWKLVDILVWVFEHVRVVVKP